MNGEQRKLDQEQERLYLWVEWYLKEQYKSRWVYTYAL